MKTHTTRKSVIFFIQLKEMKMNNFNEKFEDEIADEIYLDCGEKYDFHLLTAQDTGVISTSWEKLKTDVVFKLESVSEERKC